MGAPEEVAVLDPEEEASPNECVIQNDLLKNALVAVSFGAGAIHLWAAWQHFNFTRVLIFFVLVAALQLWLAAVILWIRNIPWSLLLGGAVANAGVVVVWIGTRTTGVPFYPKAGNMNMDKIMERAANSQHMKGFMTHKETFGLLDTSSSLLEIVFVVGVLMLIVAKRRSARAESGGDATVAAASGVAEDSPGAGPPMG